jgi:hypothetical protein
VLTPSVDTVLYEHTVPATVVFTTLLWGGINGFGGANLPIPPYSGQMGYLEMNQLLWKKRIHGT